MRRLAPRFDRTQYRRLGLGNAIFFDRETLGADRLRARTRSYGVGIKAVPAQDAWGLDLPGFDGMLLVAGTVVAGSALAHPLGRAIQG